MMKLTFIVLIGFLLTGCGEESKDESGADVENQPTPKTGQPDTNQQNETKEKPANAGVVKGVMKGGEGRAVFLEHLPIGSRDFVVLDQATIAEDGSFTLTSGVDYLEFYRIRTEPASAPPNIEYANVIFGPGDVMTFTADPDSITNTFQAKGNNYHMTLQSLFDDVFRPYQPKVNELNKQINLTDNQTKKGQLVAELNNYNEQIKNRLNELVENDPTSPTAYLAQLRLLTLKKSLNEEVTDEDLDLFDEIANGVKITMPQSFLPLQAESYARQIRQREVYERQQKNADSFLAVGSPAPEIAFPNPEGKVMKLSDLKGKVVLIDFWASWCKPCRMANPHVVKLYEKYKDSGFEILSVSLDNDKQRWIQAIAADKLDWPYHVSDLKGWQSEAAQTYGITSIPQTVLVDKQGNILAKGNEIAVNVGAPDPDALLKQKLKSIFGF